MENNGICKQALCQIVGNADSCILFDMIDDLNGSHDLTKSN